MLLNISEIMNEPFGILSDIWYNLKLSSGIVQCRKKKDLLQNNWFKSSLY